MKQKRRKNFPCRTIGKTFKNGFFFCWKFQHSYRNCSW